MAKRTIGVKVPPVAPGGKRLAITDIHGCARTFDKLLNKVGLNEDDQLFLLGDLINRGPRSRQVVDAVLSLQNEGFNIFPLMGNHEETLLHLLFESPEELQLLLRSRNSLNLLNSQGLVRKRFVRFFRQLPYFYKLNDHYLVHAGFNLNAEKPRKDTHAMVWMRNFSLKMPLSGKKVLFGHTPTKFSKIQKRIEEDAPSICLDNGCSHTYLGKEYGALICYDLDNRTLVRQKNIDQ